MDYQQTLDYLYRQLPIFQRVGKAAYKADLSNTIALCKLLDNPEHGFKSVHIAGTNGKGSTSHAIASILQEAGLKTGLYTSPHLRDFRERIRINGEMIPKQYVVDFVERYREGFEPMQTSFFELTVGMAFKYFTEEQIDIAVIETGLGGRLDSTNVILPEVSVITNISLDHTNLLGNTISEIAGEKAGIIKKDTPVVIGATVPESKAVFEAKAADMGAPILYAENESDFPYSTDLRGSYQAENLRTAKLAVEQLIKKGWDLSQRDIEAGANAVIKNTGFAGRWQQLSDSPLTITDIGHNEEGVREVLKQLALTPHEHLHFVLGVVNDKDIDTILTMLPKTATYYFCAAKIPRALAVDDLQLKAQSHSLNGQRYNSVNAAKEAAQNAAKSGDLVFIGGSAFVVAEVV